MRGGWDSSFLLDLMEIKKEERLGTIISSLDKKKEKGGEVGRMQVDHTNLRRNRKKSLIS